jgi:hypothetical protein
MALQALKAPKTAEELINGIDWELLKKQKKTLLNVIDSKFNSEPMLKKSVIEDLTGILNLVDSIQDYAVDVMGVDEKTVFDLHEE